MLSSKRIESLFALLSLVSVVTADRLSLIEGGYARVLRLQEHPLSSFTLSGWVNVTRFPEGIAPVLTYLSEDVKSQLAFFLRPEGVGILWGGPTAPSGEEVPLVDRRPRSHSPEKAKPKKKREAVDYSGGLGNIENILTKRSGEANNKWVPMNFVDVDTMGVDDLMLSGSEHVSSVADSRESRTHVYSDWTNVPYELHMEESGVDEDYVLHEEANQQEPRIITQPSGNDDFVFFNWNVPSGNQKNILLGNNNWSPVWESTKKNAEANQVQRNRNQFEERQKPTKIIDTPSKAKHVWGNEGQQGLDLSNKWDPLSRNEQRPLETKLLPTKVERPIWPSRLRVPQLQRNPPVRTTTTQSPKVQLQQNNIQTRYESKFIQKVPSNNLGIIRLQGVQIEGTTLKTIPEITIPVVSKSTTQAPTTTTTTSTTTKTTTKIPSPSTTRRSTLHPRRKIIPSLYRYTKKRKNIFTTTKPHEVKEIPRIPKPSNTRVPLWKLIKKPSKGTRRPITSTSEAAKKKNAPTYSIPTYTKPPFYTTTKPPMIKTIKHFFPEPTLLPIKPSESEDPLQALGSLRRNLYYRSRPVQSPSIARRPTTLRTTTSSPPTTPRRIPYRPTVITHRVPNYQGSRFETPTPKAKLSLWERNEDANKQYKFDAKVSNTKQNSPKFAHNKYEHTKANEFEKTMQDPKLIKEGNSAVVYAVPITNEKEFYEMYKKYQRDSLKPSKSGFNLHELYNEMRTGGVRDENEEEINENGIKTPELSLYKDTIFATNKENDLVELNVVQNEPSTTETLIITESVTTPVPRGDIPVTDYDQEEQNVTANANDYQPINTEDGGQSEDTYTVYYDDDFQGFSSDHIYDYYGNGETEEIADSATVHETNEPMSNHSEDYNTDFYVPTEEGDNVQLADLYRPKSVDAAIPPQINPSHYQEQQMLFHEQLPPQYHKPEKQYDFNDENVRDTQSTGKKDKTDPIPTAEESSDPVYDSNPTWNTKESSDPVYDSNPTWNTKESSDPVYDSNPTWNTKESSDPVYDSNPTWNTKESSDPIYSSNPLDLLSQGLIPKPIHIVRSQEEAEEWMKNQESSIREPEALAQTQTDALSPFYFSGGHDQPSIKIPPHSLPSPFPHPDQPTHPFPEITQVQNINGLSSTKLPLDIHFEKVTYPFKENSWFHLAFTWNGRTKRATIYVNGERIGAIENVLQNEQHLKGGGLFLLGKTLLPDLSDFDESSQFLGEMSDVNLWVTELSPLSVDAVFQCKYEPISPQPIDWETTQLKLYDQADMTPSPPLCGLIT